MTNSQTIIGITGRAGAGKDSAAEDKPEGKAKAKKGAKK